MAIPEACGVWIEQRVEEELAAKKNSGKSMREISRIVKAEIKKYFETEVADEAIYQRVRRAAKSAGTNVPKSNNAAKADDPKAGAKIKKIKDTRGGKRPGAGRPKKPIRQKYVWAHVDKQLHKLTAYMMTNCKDVQKAAQANVDNILVSIETLKSYEEDLRKAAQ